MFLIFMVDDARHSLGDDPFDYFSSFDCCVGAVESAASCFGTTSQSFNSIHTFLLFLGECDCIGVCLVGKRLVVPFNYGFL